MRRITEGYFTAWNRLNEAVAAFSAIEFNQRDYYVQPDGAWQQATTEEVAARKLEAEVKRVPRISHYSGGA